MNINRLRPVGVKRDDLDIWLSSVVWDAIRDAREAGMDDRHVADLMAVIAKTAAQEASLPGTRKPELPPAE